MNEPQRRRANWQQFSLSGLLLVVTAIAAFLAGRGSAHREMVNVIATLRDEIQARPATSPVRARVAISRNPVRLHNQTSSFDESGIESFDVSRVGPIMEQSTRATGKMRWISLEPGKLQWSSHKRGQSGYFYFQYGNDDSVWQFAKSPYGRIEEFAGQPLSVRFYNAGSSAIGANGQAFLVAVGDVWLARPRNEPDTVYVIKIIRQERNEAMTVKYAVLQEGASSPEN